MSVKDQKEKKFCLIMSRHIMCLFVQIKDDEYKAGLASMKFPSAYIIITQLSRPHVGILTLNMKLGQNISHMNDKKKKLLRTRWLATYAVPKHSCHSDNRIADAVSDSQTI